MKKSKKIEQLKKQLAEAKKSEENYAEMYHTSLFLKHIDRDVIIKEIKRQNTYILYSIISIVVLFTLVCFKILF